MMTVLITGGTVFVSRFTAEYFIQKGYSVYVINRNSRPQPKGVNLIECDRHSLGERLKNLYFDWVIDVTAYTEADVSTLLSALGGYGGYILISSSAVYPETLPQPFQEEQSCGENRYWGDYGRNKIAAEQLLLREDPNAYIIRPPYLYGAMNNLYREAFVFDCVEQGRPFYLPKEGKMPLQFFDVEDLCRFMEILMESNPPQKIFNVGNPETVTVAEWVRLCYRVFGKEPRFVLVNETHAQRDYFPFLDYGYRLDVTKMNGLIKNVKPLDVGLRGSYEWYAGHRELVRKKPLLEYIDRFLDYSKSV